MYCTVVYCSVLCDLVLIFTCLIAISQILYFHSVDFEICGFQSLHYTYPFIPNVLQTSFVNDSALIGANDTDINPKKVNNGNVYLNLPVSCHLSASANSQGDTLPPPLPLTDSPWGTMPFLEVDGKVIGGSSVIARYLGEKFGVLCSEHITIGCH